LFKKTTVIRTALAIAGGFPDNAPAFERGLINGGSVGPPAMLTCELGQVRKEAAAAGDACAGMWLAEPPPLSPLEKSSYVSYNRHSMASYRFIQKKG
jgi:hypothetical protein